MPLDPVIAGGFRGIELQSPLEAYGRIAQLQQAQNQNALAQYQLGAAQRAEAKDIARTNALAQAGTDDTSVANALLKAGDVKGYSEFIKSRREMQKAETDLADAKLKQARGFLDTINPADPNAPAQYIAWHEANHRDPVLGPLLAARGITADQSRARIQQAIQQGPQAFAQLLMQSKLGTEEFIKQNKPITVAPGASVYRPGETTPMFTAPAAERPYEPSELQKTLSDLKAAPPGSPEARALQARVQMLTTREPKEPREPAAPTVTQIQDPADPNRMLTIDARRYAGGSIGAPGVIGTSGKTAPAAAAEQKKAAAQGELQNVIDTLKTAYADLDAMRAVPSEQRNVISNALSYIASTGPGQVAGRIGGTQAQTQRDIIQSSRNLLFTAVKNATGKTSGELNSNVEFKTWLEALTDPSRSIQANQAILENLERFVASGGKYSAKKGAGEVKSTFAAPQSAPAAGVDTSNPLLK